MPTLTDQHDIDFLFSSPAGIYACLEDMTKQEFEILQHVSSLYSNQEKLHPVYQNLDIHLEPHNLKIEHFKKITELDKTQLQHAVLGGKIDFENVKHAAKTAASTLYKYKYDICLLYTSDAADE